MKEDLQAVRDEAAASKEVIAVLRKQVEELQKEKETLWVDADALHSAETSEFYVKSIFGIAEVPKIAKPFWHF